MVGNKTEEAVSIVVDGLVRPFINNFFDAAINDTGCPEVMPELLPGSNPNIALQRFNGFVDFRDFFLPSHQARVLGGSGTEPYGDIGSSIYTPLMYLQYAFSFS